METMWKLLVAEISSPRLKRCRGPIGGAPIFEEIGVAGPSVTLPAQDSMPPSFS